MLITVRVVSYWGKVTTTNFTISKTNKNIKKFGNHHYIEMWLLVDHYIESVFLVHHFYDKKRLLMF